MIKQHCDGCGADITVKHSQQFHLEETMPGLEKAENVMLCDGCAATLRDAIRTAKKWREEEEGRQRLDKMGMKRG